MISAIKGMNDIFPGAQDRFLDTAVWQRMMAAIDEVFAAYAYQPVWLPMVEATELFSDGLGTETDIVSKEMYSFADRGDRQLTLRPEGTAGAVRAYIEHHLSRHEALQRWYYVGPMFRAERPQKGRYRQFYQVGAEFFGVANPAADVEMVLMAQALCQRLNLGNLTLRLNTLGDADSRRAYHGALSQFFAAHLVALCASCKLRAVKNPLRVLDCKNPNCRAVLTQAPDILASLTPASRTWFDRYIALLDSQGVRYSRDPMLVRGLDYYSDVIFEMTTSDLGAQDAILGGGRYDGLVQRLGGPATPAVGFAAGMERLALLVSQEAQAKVGPDLFVAPLSEDLAGAALHLAQALRSGHGLRVEVDVAARGAKHSLRRADRQGAKAVLVLGADEQASKTAEVKRLRDGARHKTTLEAADVAAALKALGEAGEI